MAHYVFFLIISPLIFLLSASFLSFKKKYFWYEYIGLFLLPLFIVYLSFFAEGYLMVMVFFSFCVAGPLVEAIAGNVILHFSGKHLWLYEAHPLFNKTTSLVCVPFWGLAGTVFFSVDRLIASLFGK
jgi:hypothetical protein